MAQEELARQPAPKELVGGKGTILCFGGGHGWPLERNNKEAENLARQLGYDYFFGMPTPRSDGVRSRVRGTEIIFSDGRIEKVPSFKAWRRFAADPEVVSIVSEWQQKRAESLLEALDSQSLNGNRSIDIIANSASTLTALLALQMAAKRYKDTGGDTRSPIRNIVLAFPAGLIKKESRAEDQRRTARRGMELAKNRFLGREQKNRQHGRIRTMAWNMMKTGGIIAEQTSAAVSLHTGILTQLVESGMPINLYLVLGDQDVMFPAQRILESLPPGVLGKIIQKVLVLPVNHGWSKPGRNDEVVKHYGELLSSDGPQIIFGDGMAESRRTQLTELFATKISAS